MIGERKRVFDLGCNEGIGTHFLSEFSEYTCGIAFDEECIRWAKENLENEKLKFICEDFLGKKYEKFDAIVSMDVIEHIFQANEELYMQTVLDNLQNTGVFIIGTPNKECEKYSNPKIAGAHINLFTGERLRELMNRYFNNVFSFTQNDEVIHTGFFPTANYLICLCCYRKPSFS